MISLTKLAQGLAIAAVIPLAALGLWTVPSSATT